MPSFYKFNLMEGYNSTLIPPENDLKKEEKSIKIDVSNVEESKPAAHEIQRPSVYYPYKNMVRGSYVLIGVAMVLCVTYTACFETEKRDERLDRSGNIIPQNFLDPCNVSDVLSFDEVYKIRFQGSVIGAEMSSINKIVRYNISTLTNEYLTEKLTNLSTAYTNLEQKLQEQKDIRFACFKLNLEERCKNIMSSPYIFNGVYIYVIACAILLTNSFYYISKAKKLDLTDEQLKVCNNDYHFSIMIIIHHVTCAIVIGFLVFWSSNNECDIEKDLGKFPPYLFL